MKNRVPLILVFCLFFLWAISSNLLPTMIRQLMKTCELNTFEASFTESAYWLAYLVMAIVGNACVPQFTAFIMHNNYEVYQIAYVVPMICFAVCAAYGIKVMKEKNT